MRINQIFKSYIPDNLFVKILFSFGFETENYDGVLFNKFDLFRISTAKRLEELKNEISKYYLPCKELS